MDYFPTRPYTVMVVGAASGIGAAAARFLAQQGVQVACLDRETAAVNAVAESIIADGSAAEAHYADVCDPHSVAAACGAVFKSLRQVHAMVNCVGITGLTNVPGHEVALDDFDLVYRVNLRGALVLSQAVLPHMLDFDYGRILHVSSIAGKEGNANMTAYSATKAGLIGLVKSLGKDYAVTGITVNGLAPAVIRTPLVDALPEATVTYMTGKIPMQRCGELQEAAAMIGWILSPACSFTTGFTFDLSGGRATY